MPWLVHRSWHHFIYTFSKGLEVISSRGCALEYWQRLLSWQSFQIFYIVSYCFVQYCALEVWRKQRWYFNSYGNSLLPMCSELCEVWELEGPGKYLGVLSCEEQKNPQSPSNTWLRWALPATSFPLHLHEGLVSGQQDSSSSHAGCAHYILVCSSALLTRWEIMKLPNPFILTFAYK